VSASAFRNRATAAEGLRPLIVDLADSQIREVSRAGIGDPNVIPLWFGEPDRPTPGFIAEAAKAAMDAGKTLYCPSNGVPELRRTIAAYQSRLKGREIGTERITVTASGMNAIQMVMQMLVSPGERVVVVSPMWPNIREVVRMLGGEVVEVTLDSRDGSWRLDLESLFRAVDSGIRSVFLNSPSNPTGWVMPAEQQRSVLDYCRARGVWVIADEVYERIVYDRDLAPSFLAIAEPEDRVIGVNSFSKNWSMTGWRLGWIVAPPSLEGHLAKITEFNTANAATPIQWAGIAAIRDGEAFVAEQISHWRRSRDLVVQRLSANPRIRLNRPQGAFYAFFAVDELKDSLAFAKRLVAEHRLGLAPGSAFGAGGEGHLRLCFASSAETLSRAMDRLDAAVSRI
jgi:aspartate/methionine/tyrosine aminotransferase